MSTFTSTHSCNVCCNPDVGLHCDTVYIPGFLTVDQTARALERNLAHNGMPYRVSRTMPAREAKPMPPYCIGSVSLVGFEEPTFITTGEERPYLFFFEPRTDAADEGA